MAKKTTSVAYQELDLPIGRLTLFFSAKGLCRVVLPGVSAQSVRAELRRRFGSTDFVPSVGDRPATIWLRDFYFKRDFHAPDFPLDIELTPFQREVLQFVSDIPVGETRSYGKVARGIGRPGASRAVGGALRANPIPIVIPCHRVVTSNGSLGGFAGGTTLKLALL